MCERIDAGRPIAHVAAEGGLSRQTLSKWYRRWCLYGEAGLLDRNSEPHVKPNETPPDIVQMILELRRDKKWGAARIAAYLETVGDELIKVSPATVHRVMVRHGVSRLRDMDRPTGDSKRDPNRYEHDAPGDMIHVDIKKVGRIPKGGGHRIHEHGTDEHRASKRQAARRGKVGYAYLHNAVDDHSRLAYTEVLDDEKGGTAAEFWLRAAIFFREHGIVHIKRCLTDNGSPYRSRDFAAALGATNTAHKRTQPYTPRTNGKVERYNQIMMAEWLYVREYDSEESRTAYLADFLNYYNHERQHSGIGFKVPASRVPVATFRIAPQDEWLPTVDVSEFEMQEGLFEL